MRSIIWSSTADYGVNSEMDVQPRDLDVLVAEWTAAKDKGGYIAALPLCEAAALCAVAKERLPLPERTRSETLHNATKVDKS